MKLHNAVQDQPIVSNVGEIGEFRIRNSAKAFSILSSGLYANKIRAIIRELSCNAIDSHVAAGKIGTPFDVHLPNQLEPWFAIRDYGTGLNHDQVTNIYTTYFESTKTNSNDFIGALGLGSKSPFSYTDNFTVTAVKDGRKGIYTAFINEQGVPSIALMMEEQTTDPAGVEVKFSVNDRYDFDKFKSEARAVYKWFKQRPVISGVSNFQFDEVDYETKDIIPGVHSVNTNGRHTSVAIMGNIAYNIQVPDSDQTLGDLRKLLSCGLVMEFNIGELDFQASREGLSYIPETIAAIKNKLEALNVQLAIHVKQEAEKITNIWEKTLYLVNKGGIPLWDNAVTKYVADIKFEYIDNRHNWLRSKEFKVTEKDLQSMNIQLRRFSKSRHANTAVNKKIGVSHDSATQSLISYWEIQINNGARFVINDTKVGATERAKFHMKSTSYLKDNNINTIDCIVIESLDKSKPIDLVAFKALIANPPENYFMLASSLAERERSNGSIGRNVTIMRLEEGRTRGWRRSPEMVWRDAGKASSFDDKETHYYIPLSGYQALNRVSDVKGLANHVAQAGVYSGHIYGVRKTDIEWVKKQKNWVELDKLIIDKLAKMDKENVMGLVKQALDINDLIKYNSLYIKQDSPFVKLVNLFQSVKAIDSHVQSSTQWLCKQYDVKTSTSPQQLIDKYTKEVNDVKNRYPLLKNLSSYTIDKNAVAEYINLIDAHKGI